MLIQEYKQDWMNDFRGIKKVMEEALVNLTFSIEHIGSTSIPGLAAKPIIDIDIVYNEAEEFTEIKKRLENIGYNHNGNQGIPGREVFKRKKEATMHEVLDSIAHHLYVCPANSEELQKHILFRDYLIANDEARMQYEQLKFEIVAEASQDRKKYAQLKELKAKKFIESIIAKATPGL